MESVMASVTIYTRMTVRIASQYGVLLERIGLDAQHVLSAENRDGELF